MILLANYFDGENSEISGLILVQIQKFQSQNRRNLGFASSIVSWQQVQFGADFPFGVAVSRKVRAFNRGW